MKLFYGVLKECEEKFKNKFNSKCNNIDETNTRNSVINTEFKISSNQIIVIIYILDKHFFYFISCFVCNYL